MARLAQIEAVVVLQSVDLFCFCKAEQVLRIAGIAGERGFTAGERIYEANAPADALYAVVHGGVRLTGSDGEVQEVGPLSTFGVWEILSGRLRDGEAAATEDTLVLSIDAEDFFDLLANNIEIVRALFRHLLQDGRPVVSGARVPEERRR